MSLDFDGARLPNPYLTEDHEAWRDQLRKFIDSELMPYANQWEEDHKVPDEIFPKAAEVGMFAVGYPEAYGGLTEGLDVWHYASQKPRGLTYSYAICATSERASWTNPLKQIGESSPAEIDFRSRKEN